MFIDGSLMRHHCRVAKKLSLHISLLEFLSLEGGVERLHELGSLVFQVIKSIIFIMQSDFC